MDQTCLPFDGDVADALGYTCEILTQHHFRILSRTDNAIEAEADPRLRSKTEHAFQALPRITVSFDDGHLRVLAETPHMACVDDLMAQILSPAKRLPGRIPDRTAARLSQRFKADVTVDVPFDGDIQPALVFLAVVLSRLGFKSKINEDTLLAENTSRAVHAIARAKELRRSPTLNLSRVRVVAHDGNLRIEGNTGRFRRVSVSREKWKLLSVVAWTVLALEGYIPWWIVAVAMSGIVADVGVQTWVSRHPVAQEAGWALETFLLNAAALFSVQV